MWSFAAGQQETHVCLEAGDLWGLESGICLLVAPEISLVEEDFFSPTPGPFQKQTPQLLVCSKSSLYGFAWVLNLSSEITSVQRIYASALLKGSFFPKDLVPGLLVKKEAFKPQKPRKQKEINTWEQLKHLQ